MMQLLCIISFVCTVAMGAATLTVNKNNRVLKVYMLGICFLIFIGSLYMLYYKNTVTGTYTKFVKWDNIITLQKCNVYRFTDDKCYNFKYKEISRVVNIPEEQQVWKLYNQ